MKIDDRFRLHMDVRCARWHRRFTLVPGRVHVTRNEIRMRIAPWFRAFALVLRVLRWAHLITVKLEA